MHAHGSGHCTAPGLARGQLLKGPRQAVKAGNVYTCRLWFAKWQQKLSVACKADVTLLAENMGFCGPRGTMSVHQLIVLPGKLCSVRP